MIRVSKRNKRALRLEKMLRRLSVYGLDTPASKKLLVRACKLVTDLGLSLYELFGSHVSGAQKG